MLYLDNPERSQRARLITKRLDKLQTAIRTHIFLRVLYVTCEPIHTYDTDTRVTATRPVLLNVDDKHKLDASAFPQQGTQTTTHARTHTQNNIVFPNGF